MIALRSYQWPIFHDRTTGILVLHWSRQIGKSFTLAAWAVDRLLTQLPQHGTWLVTVLSNSRDNGAEFVRKGGLICEQLGIARRHGSTGESSEPSARTFETADESTDLQYENMRMELCITLQVKGRARTGRIKVLAANPRTARGFSGDLILDEFAFHEDSAAIWEAAEPILSANHEYLCRIASTGNGRHNMFYRFANGAGPDDGTLFPSPIGNLVSRVTRTGAWRIGVPIFDAQTRASITPAQARAQAFDHHAYDQNYECSFADENMGLLTRELISAAERSDCPVDEQEWSATSLARLKQARGTLHVGHDIGRHHDLSVITVLELRDGMKRVVGMLRMRGLRLPEQQRQCALVCALPRFIAYVGDLTGLGLGLIENLQERFGTERVRGINFASTEPINADLQMEGRKHATARVTEIMATQLLAEFEARTLEIPADNQLREDLRRPERITSPGGRVSIAASRDGAGHADHFWSLALAVRACAGTHGPLEYQSASRDERHSIQRKRGLII